MSSAGSKSLQRFLQTPRNSPDPRVLLYVGLALLALWVDEAMDVMSKGGLHKVCAGYYLLQIGVIGLMITVSLWLYSDRRKPTEPHRPVAQCTKKAAQISSSFAPAASRDVGRCSKNGGASGKSSPPRHTGSLTCAGSDRSSAMVGSPTATLEKLRLGVIASMQEHRPCRLPTQRGACHPKPSSRTGQHVRGGAKLANLSQAITLAGKNGDHLRSENLFQEIVHLGVTPDPVTYNAVIHACARNGELDRADFWISRMQEDGCWPNASTFNIPMGACAKVGDVDAAEQYMRRMQELGIEPNDVSYSTLIHAYAKRDDAQLAEKWLRAMIQDGIDPNIACYNSLIAACGRTGDVERAELFIREMEERGVSPGVTTYTSMVDACAKMVDVEGAQYWMEKMLLADIEPNVVSYCSMIYACAQVGDPTRAEHWHLEMVRRGVKPNAHSFSSLINAYAKMGDTCSACKWLTRMGEAGVPADVVAYANVLDACAKAGDSDKASDVFHHMLTAGVRPNLVSYASLARPFAREGNWKKVEELSEQMTARGLTMNAYFLNALLVAYANCQPMQDSRAEAALREAHAGGVEINKHVISASSRVLGRIRTRALLQELNITPVPVESRRPIRRASKVFCRTISI